MNTSGIERVALHANAIAEDRAARERRGRIDADHADALALRAVVRDQRIDDGGLARARVAGDADDVALAGVREQRLQRRPCASGRRSSRSRISRAAARISPSRSARCSSSWLGSLEPLLGTGGRIELYARARSRCAANACFVFGGIWITEVGVTATPGPQSSSCRCPRAR